jgi:hypothetical protein
MKTTISSLILLAAIVLPIHADSPVPASSSIEIKMTRTVKIAEEPTKEEEQAEKAKNAKYHNCFGNDAHYSLEPLFRRGQDAKTCNLVLSIYIITTNTEREYAILRPISQAVPSDSKVPLVTDTSYHHLIQWRCACRSEGRTMETSPEWYAEVIQDGKVLCSAQSKSNTTVNKLIGNRVSILDVTPKAVPFFGKWYCNGLKSDIYQIYSDKTATHFGDKGSWMASDDLLTISWENGYRLTFDITQTGDPIIGKSYPPGKSKPDELKFTKPLSTITLPSARVITDTQGRRVSGIILGKTGNFINFRRDSDGKLVSISLEKLSEDDQKFISSAVQVIE